MASISGDATSADPQGQQSPLSSAGDAVESSSGFRDSGVQSPGKRNTAGAISLGGEESKDAGDVSFLTFNQISMAGNNQDSEDHDKRKQQSSKRGSRETTGVGVLRLSPADSGTSRKEQELWQKLEDIMASKQSQVQQVLEEFGIAADVQPASDQLEEQVWRVVQGELTLQEAADLV